MSVGDSLTRDANKFKSVPYVLLFIVALKITIRAYKIQQLAQDKQSAKAQVNARLEFHAHILDGV